MAEVDRRTLFVAGGLLAAAGMSGAEAAEPSSGPLPVPGVRPAFSARITLGAPIELGTIAGVRKRIIPITGGTFTGARIEGTVLPGGADWQFIRDDGVADLSARYTLRAADGTHISATNAGLRRGPADVMRMIAEGKQVDPAAYYFRTAARFEVATGPHQWLGDSVFLCTGGRFSDYVLLQFFEVV
jgi:hypothetical protein